MTTQIQTELIADNAIATAKIADAAVSTNKIADAGVTPTKLSQKLTQGTAVASTSGTSIDFTAIPSWVKRITIGLNGVSTNGSSILQVQIGSSSGGLETTGYASQASTFNNTPGGVGFTSGFALTAIEASTYVWSGVVQLVNVSGNIWVTSGTLMTNTANSTTLFAGNKTISSVLDRVRITTVNGIDTFDAGSINILYE